MGLKTIVLDSKESPICIIETTEVSIHAFNEVDAQFAYNEGEDDRTLESWRREHWKCFVAYLLALITETPELANIHKDLPQYRSFCSSVKHCQGWIAG